MNFTSSLKKKLSNIRRKDEQFVYFLGFLYALSTGDMSSVEVVKITGSANYGKYSETFQKIFRLGVGWGYGLTKSCEAVAMKLTHSEEENFKQHIIKFAQVLRLGDTLTPFFHAELSVHLHDYSIQYERNLETQKLFLEMYYTLMSTASVMIAANSMLTMLMGAGDSESIMMMAVIGIVIGMGTFAVMMYVLFPRDALVIGTTVTKKIKVWHFVSLIISVFIVLVLFVINALPLGLISGIATIPLFIPGYLYMRLETKIKKLNGWYPSFIRHFGQIYATISSVSQTLDSVLRSDFGLLTKYGIELKNRIKNGIDPEVAFNLFSKEIGSSAITNANTIIAKCMSKGSDMNAIGNKVAEVTERITELRTKREQTSKTFETIIIVLHVLSLAIFGLMNKLSAIFEEILAGLPTSNMTMSFHPIDQNFMQIMLPILVLATSVINALAIKIAQGGLYKTIWFHIALLNLIGALTVYGTEIAISKFLEAGLIQSLAPT